MVEVQVPTGEHTSDRWMADAALGRRSTSYIDSVSPGTATKSVDRTKDSRESTASARPKAPAFSDLPVPVAFPADEREEGDALEQCDSMPERPTRPTRHHSSPFRIKEPFSPWRRTPPISFAMLSFVMPDGQSSSGSNRSKPASAAQLPPTEDLDVLFTIVAAATVVLIAVFACFELNGG